MNAPRHEFYGLPVRKRLRPKPLRDDSLLPPGSWTWFYERQEDGSMAFVAPVPADVAEFYFVEGEA